MAFSRVIFTHFEPLWNILMWSLGYERWRSVGVWGCSVLLKMGCIAIAVPMTSPLDRSVNVKMVLSPHFSVGYQWWVNRLSDSSHLNPYQCQPNSLSCQANKEYTIKQSNKMVAMTLLLVCIKDVESTIAYNDYLVFSLTVPIWNWIIKI